MEKYRIAFLFGNLGAYHWARLNILKNMGLEPKVAVFHRGLSKIAYETSMSSGSLTAHDLGTKSSEVQTKLKMWLADVRPNAVFVAGWNDPIVLSCLSHCLASKIPIFVMTDTTQEDKKRNSISEYFKSRIIRLFSGALVAGRRQKKYIQSLGFEGSVTLGYCSVDNLHFSTSAQSARSRAAFWRQKLKLPSKYFAIFARLSSEKNIACAIDAFRISIGRGLSSKWQLLILGDGPLRPSLERKIMDAGLTERIKLLGSIQYELLPVYYAFARATILPSLIEPWGLVVNESLACGTPVIASGKCGSSEHLISNGISGFTFDPNSPDELERKIFYLSKKSNQAVLMGKNGAKIVQEWGPERFGKSVLDLVDEIGTNKILRLGYFDKALLFFLSGTRINKLMTYISYALKN